MTYIYYIRLIKECDWCVFKRSTFVGLLVSFFVLVYAETERNCVSGILEELLVYLNKCCVYITKCKRGPHC
jgi:hypothetical protein